MELLKSITLIFLFLTLLRSQKIDYYWRDYLGDIPDDAFPGGSDRNHKPTYIAQVHIPNHGMLPARIYQGEKSVITSKNGIHSSKVFVKILCSDHSDKLSWVTTTAETLHNDTVVKHLVVGGTEDGKILNIGRVYYEGEVIVGKVTGYEHNNSLLYFPYDGEEVAVASYEVLTYSNAY